MQPCPGCGLYQPDMIGAGRARLHWWAFAGTLVALLALLILALTEVLAYSTTAWVAAGVAFFVLLVHLVIDANNPNRDPEANHRLALAPLGFVTVETRAGCLPKASQSAPAERNKSATLLSGAGGPGEARRSYALIR